MKKFLEKIFCRHIYEDTGETCTFLTFSNGYEVLHVYKCKKCGKEIRLDSWGRKYRP